MKRKIFYLIFMIACASCFAKQTLDETLSTVSQDIANRCEKREIIAILDFKTDTTEMSEYISNQLTAMIFENSALQVVTRQHMDKIEKELKFQSSGLVSDSTALSIGERLGAHEIIFGSLEELNNQYILQIKMLNVKNASYSLFKKYDVSRSSVTEQLLHHASTIYKSSLGLFLELNKNSISFVAPAVGISFDYSFTRKLSVGGKVIVSYDAFEKENTVYSIEPLALVRWYIVSPTGEPSAGLFIEGDVGVELLLINSDFNTAPSIGAGLGFRFPLRDYYIEPIIRGGYPYLFGIGVNGGFRF